MDLWSTQYTTPRGNESIVAIIPVSGRPQLLADALRSVANQSLLPDHVIVVVDSLGSPAFREDQQSALECEAFFLSRSKPVRYTILNTTALGPGGARNSALLASGEAFVAFLDSDDLWMEEKLEQQLAFLRRRPHLAGCQTRESWNRHGHHLQQPERLIPHAGRPLEASLQVCLVSPSALMIRREVLLSLEGFDQSFFVCEDYELLLRLFSHHSLGVLEQFLVEKRSGGWEQLSQPGGLLDLERARALLKNLKNEKWSSTIQASALREFFHKLDLVQSGAIKRGNQDPTLALRQQADLFLKSPS